MKPDFETTVQELQERISDAFLGTLAKLSPMTAEDFGSLLRSTMTKQLGDALISALLAAGWISFTREGRLLDISKNSPHNGDVVTLCTSTPSSAALRKALQS